jgi:TRAP-type C4-dicarboxylate transport system permease small subunit
MTKKKTKKDTKHKKRRKPLEAAGWGTYLIVFCVILGPSIGLMYVLQNELASPAAFLPIGVFFAALTAGVVTWILNGILQLRARRNAARVKAKH